MPTGRGFSVFAVAYQSDETPMIRTVRMKGNLTANPGQFVMVWVPGTDEFPMSLSHIGEDFGITYKVIGRGTERLSALKKDERIGVRGPYGHGFKLDGKKVLVVSGGTGMACLAPFVELASEGGAAVDVVLGARTKSELLMKDRCIRAGASVHITTDDGSEGDKGFATDGARALLEQGGYDHVYTCGPERMIAGVLEASTALGVPIQASLERYMKCGIGICDSCAIDGRHVCVDGQVFSGDDLLTFAELGKTKLNRSGARVSID